MTNLLKKVETKLNVILALKGVRHNCKALVLAQQY